ncbi:putative osmoprotectant uptake system substrate-binding protein OsmF precursor [Clavibacter michiganensis]|uniref:Putative osmoprotectant uptake system substrate-binding protein OsmF n=1 Tax=Clavibacter michiganensis TaxID=28447 RepID=A0A251Y276_9MICO|nr:ABC transporter substrate-binding protein [Clavibacter michiganensis]OUE18360.1 putative osmoprotectant uptake system substrate-binding protein OsmF precursor [Clavibacter michiganensis]
MSHSISRRLLVGTVALGTAMALAGCSSGDPLDTSGGQASAAPSDTISVGSAAFGENVILAEVYAQALEANDVKVTRNLQIGEREVYLKALEEGSIDLIPEYTGNLLAAYDADSTTTSSDDVYSALGSALPDGFEVLDQSPAEDKDSYNVTKEYSDANGVTSLSDLAGKGTINVGGGAVLGEREYGIPGLTDTYGIDAKLVTIEDQGGPNTVKALVDGQVQIANIYSTTPSILDNGFVTLEDPENLIKAQNVVPLVKTAKMNPDITSILDKVSAALTTEDLTEMNRRNQGDEKAEPAAIAADWLKEKALF